MEELRSNVSNLAEQFNTQFSTLSTTVQGFHSSLDSFRQSVHEDQTSLRQDIQKMGNLLSHLIESLPDAMKQSSAMQVDGNDSINSDQME